MSKHKKNKETKVSVPSSAKPGTEDLELNRIFFKTAEGKLGVKKKAVDFWIENEDDLESRIVLQTLMELGCRIGEFTQILKENIEGNMITLKNLKKSKKDTNKTRELVVSDDLARILHMWKKKTNGDKVFSKTARHYRKLLKKYHNKLSPHCFRRGLATWMLKQGATKDYISARLGHKDNRSLRYYLPVEERESNEFMGKVFSGIDTRKVSDLSISELKQLLGLE